MRRAQSPTRHSKPEDSRPLMRRVRSWFRWILIDSRDAILTCLVGLLLVSVAPILVGWKSTVVVSGSMMPSIKPGDVISAAPPPDKVEPGTVVLVDDPAHRGELLMHRVIRIDDTGNLITKGDANQTADSTPVPMTNLVGVPRIRIPYVGLPYLWIQQERYVPVVATVILLAGLLLWRPSKPRRPRDEPKPPTDPGKILNGPVDADSHRILRVPRSVLNGPVDAYSYRFRRLPAVNLFATQLHLSATRTLPRSRRTGSVKPPLRFHRGNRKGENNMRGIINKAVRAATANVRLGRGVAVAVGMVACSTVVWSSSHATFTASTSNDSNSFAAGTVNLTDNDGGVAKTFNLSNMYPGQTGEACIGVKNSGSLAPAVSMYFASAFEGDNGAAISTPWAATGNAKMDDVLTMKIEVTTTDSGTDPTSTCGGGTFASLTGSGSAPTLKSLITANTNFATGLPLPAPNTTIAANMWRQYKFTYTLPSSADDSVQGDGVQFNLVWDGQK